MDVPDDLSELTLDGDARNERIPGQPDPGRTEIVPEGMGKWSRIAAVLFVAACVAFWIFAFSPAARNMFTAPDEITDVTYVAAIETRCSVTVAEMAALPSSRSAETPQERGEIVELANAALQRMRDDLAALPSGSSDDLELTELWLADWDFYLEDRVAHANKLLAGEDGRFLNTERDGIFIAERMSGFARRNEIRSCLPPGDL